MRPSDRDFAEKLAKQRLLIALGCSFCGVRLLDGRGNPRLNVGLRVVYDGPHDDVGRPCCDYCHTIATSEHD